MTAPPTARQLQVLRAIYDYWHEHSYPPTIRELGTLLGIKSTNGVNDHLAALRKKGLVKPRPAGPQTGRTLMLTGEGYDAVEGRAA